MYSVHRVTNIYICLSVLAGERRRRSELSINCQSSDVDVAWGQQQQQRDHPRRRSVRAVFARLLENKAVPKLIVLTVSLCVVYVLLGLAVDVLTVERVSSAGLLAVYTDTVSALVNATNVDVSATAAAYNSLVIPQFAELIHAQIANLQQLVNHFNDGLYSLQLQCSPVQHGRQNSSATPGDWKFSICPIQGRYLSQPFICGGVRVDSFLIENFST